MNLPNIKRVPAFSQQACGKSCLQCIYMTVCTYTHVEYLLDYCSVCCNYMQCIVYGHTYSLAFGDYRTVPKVRLGTTITHTKSKCKLFIITVQFNHVNLNCMLGLHACSICKVGQTKIQMFENEMQKWQYLCGCTKLTIRLFGFFYQNSQNSVQQNHSCN